MCIKHLFPGFVYLCPVPQQSVEYALAASTVEYARVIAAASPGCTTHQGTARRITPSTNTPANQKGIWVELLVFCVQLACGACIYRYATHATATAMAHMHAKRDDIPIQVRFRPPKSQKKFQRAEFLYANRLIYFALEVRRKSPARSS